MGFSAFQGITLLGSGLFVAGAGGGPATPDTIEGNILWVDGRTDYISRLFKDAAGTMPVVSDGDVVGRAEDGSGQANHVTQATTANKPLYRTADGGYLEFDGTDDWLQKVFAAQQTQPNTIIYSARADNAENDVFYFYDGTTLTTRHAHFADSGPTPDDIGLNAGTTITPADQPKNTRDTYAVVFNGASTIFRLNGSESSPGSPGAQNLDGITLGDRFNFARPLAGRIYSILIYNRTLTTEEIESMESFVGGA